MTTGEASDTLMLVTGGSVEVERPGRRLTLGVGALIGEIEVLDPGAGRMATITAETETTCIVVTRAELLDGLDRGSAGRDRAARDPRGPVPRDRVSERARRSAACVAPYERLAWPRGP